MATPGQLQMFNKMEINEMFGLDHRAEDKRTGTIHRIHIYPDEKVPDACTFHIWTEDHTLGNALRMELLRNDAVMFAGYKVPHPLDHMIELRIQTMGEKSSPEQAIRRAVRNLRTECRSMLSQFDTGVAALKRGEKAPAMTGGLPPDVTSQSDTDAQRTEEDVQMGSGDDRTGEQLEEQLRKFEEIAGRSPSYSPTSPAAAGTEPAP
eukprot:gnl/TRDRNA2_/TRDRNA2_183417_c0_seq1.p1 gnl/TRDRNA2_/TRDRNA2_183417_c0~~gnl/TRDRNA2_/TRDRNA2_183417_c0_seq1.p1  ORF type:complete len:207 (+),score=31.57 gnl/TRDRNA2_/TRDRNA2_183417_c0_seq1:140-760(+)